MLSDTKVVINSIITLNVSERTLLGYFDLKGNKNYAKSVNNNKSTRTYTYLIHWFKSLKTASLIIGCGLNIVESLPILYQVKANDCI